MCTVVCRFAPDESFPVQILALRDELATREFDLPAAWWADQPDTIGGRDRVAGGSWCVTDVQRGVTAVVLNRPERRNATPGAPSRGVLPLIAAQHGARWTEYLDVTGMASFNLVLVEASTLQWWWFDGTALHHESLPAGTYTFTPRGLADTMDPRLAAGSARTDQIDTGETGDVWPEWLSVVRDTPPSEDPGGFIVRLPVPGNPANTYETVFGQFLATRPGRLRLDYLRQPAARGTDREWTTHHYPSAELTRPVA